MSFEASQTKQNLLAAFSGESMARNKYLFSAEKARKEGLMEIADLFESMAKNEGVHGRLFYEKAIGISSTVGNLKDAIRGEYGEWSSLYPQFAQTAREEGYDDIAELFEGVAKIEQDHEYQFMATLTQLQSSQRAASAAASAAAPAPEPPKPPKTVQAKGYRCLFCGAIFEQRPDVCSVCHAIDSFEPVTYQKQV